MFLEVCVSKFRWRGWRAPKKRAPNNLKTLALKRYEETQKVKCVACNVCAVVCPAQAINIQGGMVNGVPVLDKMQVKVDQCISCDLCVQACPMDALCFALSPEHALGPSNVLTLREDFPNDK